MAVFRTVAANASESSLPGTTKPPGFKPTVPRPGGPLTWDWFVVFVDTEGKQMVGGKATVQWYAVEVDGGAYLTPTIGAPVTADALEIGRKSFGAGLYPWCTVSSTVPPFVPPKTIDITIGSAADGTYTIDVEGYGSNPVATFAASGDAVDDIRDALVGSFSHPDLFAQPGDAGVLQVSAYEGGLDFALELTSPDDDMTQEVAQAVSPAPAGLEIRTAVSAAAEVDTTAITEAIEAIDFEQAATDAITEACAAGGAIRNTVRPDGGGATVTLVDGPDAGGGAAYYEIVAAHANKTTLQHFTIQTDKPIRYALWSSTSATIYGTIDLAESIELDASSIPAQWSAGAGGFRSIKTNGNEALVLRVSDRTAEVKFAYFACFTDDN